MDCFAVEWRQLFTLRGRRKGRDMSGIWRGLVTAVCLMTCAPALAAGFDLATGPSVTSSGRTTRAIFASVFGEYRTDNHIHFEPIGTLGWVDSRTTP